ncbi:MAG: FAD-dependent oxidoreductase [Anaerolineae bacterium]
MTDQPDVLIIGAGVTGLTAARELAALGKSTLVLDKGRSVGGRLDTRRVGQGVADTGAQFFTTRTPEFAAQVAEWSAEGFVFEWSRGWSDGSLTTVREGHPRYAVKGGMSQLAKYLAKGLNVQLLQVITAIRRTPGGWQVERANGGHFEAPTILLTPPVPQSLELLDEGGVKLPFDVRESLGRIEYDPCVCGLFTLSRPVDLPSPGAVQRPHANLHWVADNYRKGISPYAVVLTAQASSSYSRALWSADDDTIIRSMKLDLMPFLGDHTSVLAAEIKRWRYAAPIRLYPEPALLTSIPLDDESSALLAFAGDAFGAARIEGAYLSGKAAAHKLAEAMG